MKRFPHPLLVLPALLVACSGGGGGSAPGGAAPQSVLGAILPGARLAQVATGTGFVTPEPGIGPAGHRFRSGFSMDSAGNRMWTYDSGHDVIVQVTPTGVMTQMGSPTVPLATHDWDAQEGVLLAIHDKGVNDALVRVDPISGQTEVVGSTADVFTVAFDPGARRLYGIRSNGNLMSIEPNNGAATLLFNHSQLMGMRDIAWDPVNGVLIGVDNQNAARLWTIDPFASTVTLLETLDDKMSGLAIDAGQARAFGMASSGEVVTVDLDDGELERVAVLARDYMAFSFDPSDGRYFASDALTRDLVKLNPLTGVAVTLGNLGDHYVESLAHDAGTGTLYGVDSSTRQLLRIDLSPVQVTSYPSVVFSVGVHLAFDPNSGDLFGYDPQLDAGVQVDLSVPNHWLTSSQVLTFNANESFSLKDLAYDPITDRLIGVGYRKTVNGNGTSFDEVVVSFDPRVKFSRKFLLFNEGPYLTAIGRSATPGRYHAFDAGHPLLELELDAADPNASVLRGLRQPWEGDYVGAVGADGTIYAATTSKLFAIDQASGDSELLGEFPSGVTPFDLQWDPERKYVGLRDGSSVTWVRPVEPDVVRDTDQLGLLAQSVLWDPRYEDRYLVSRHGILSIIDLSSGTPKITDLTTDPPSGVVESSATLVPSLDAVFVATKDRRLFRVHASTGVWTEVGWTTRRVEGLFER